MPDLLRRPARTRGLVHDLDPQAAGWRYVGFHLHRLEPGAKAGGRLQGVEAILVIVEGRARVAGAGQDWGAMGDRGSVFARTPPHALYLPPGSDWQAEANTDCEIALCTAPARGGLPAVRLGPEGITPATRGRGANTRHIHPIAMEDRPVAETLLVTETFTPDGNWSSHPPHRHDEDDFPRITYLEETYYHRLNPPQGFGVQRVWTEDGSLDETLAVRDRDLVLVPRGHHPFGVAYGYESYYLNVMAGPRRAWRVQNHPDHDWIAQRDA